jgi:hypothetical protein
MRANHFNALALCAGGAAWPSLYGALAALWRSPLERAMESAWCGAAPHSGAEFLGHCGVCYVGTAAFALAGALALISRRKRVHGFAAPRE